MMIAIAYLHNCNDIQMDSNDCIKFSVGGVMYASSRSKLRGERRSKWVSLPSISSDKRQQSHAVKIFADISEVLSKLSTSASILRLHRTRSTRLELALASSATPSCTIAGNIKPSGFLRCTFGRCDVRRTRS
jgi:hypothetical protein